MGKGWTLANMPRQDGRRAIVTGGNSGIGEATALDLARRGATVVIASRNLRKAEAAALRMRKEVPPERIVTAELDLASLASVHRFAADELARPEPLDLLINNAGVMAPPKRLQTEDGFELQFGINVLGPFALTGLLLPKLEQRAVRADKTAGFVEGEHTTPRVVMLASVAHRRGKLHFDDLQATRSYSPMGSYQQSKLADLMLALELDRRLRAKGSTVLSVAAHPGFANTNLFRSESHGSFENAVRGAVARVIQMLFNSSAQGAVPTLYAATSSEAIGGGYYGPTSLAETRGGDAGPSKTSSQAHDLTDASRLWSACEDLTGIRFP